MTSAARPQKRPADGLSAPGEPAGLIVVDRVAEKVAFARIVDQPVALRRGGDLVWLGRR